MREFFHFLRKIAVIPSGPDAELFFSSSIASIISSSVKSMFSKHISEGLLNTDEYCVDNKFAILEDEAVYSLFWSRSGPIEDHVDENCFAYEKKYLELLLMALTTSCSFLLRASKCDFWIRT